MAHAPGFCRNRAALRAPGGRARTMPLCALRAREGGLSKSSRFSVGTFAGTRETSAPRGARLGGLCVFFIGLEARWPNIIRLVRKINMPCNAKDNKQQSRKNQQSKNSKPQTTPTTTPTTPRTPIILQLLRPLLVPYCALCLLAPDKKTPCGNRPGFVVLTVRRWAFLEMRIELVDTPRRSGVTSRCLFVRDRGFGRFAKAATFFHSAARHRVQHARRRRLSVREGSAPCACPLRRHRARHRSHRSRRRSRRCARRSRPRRRPRCCPCLRPRLHPCRRYGVVASEATAKRR